MQYKSKPYIKKNWPKQAKYKKKEVSILDQAKQEWVPILE